MGTPEFAEAGLQALVEGGYNVVGVVTMPDKPAGRGHKIQYSPVKEYALAQGLKVMQPERLKDEAFVEELRACRADLQIVVAFRMLPEVVWAMPEYGTFNVHGSLLPQYRGAAPINWAIINGDKETGLTTFMLKHEIDTGNIILQERIAIGEDEDAGSVHDRLMELSRSMVTRTTDLIIDCADRGCELPVTPQPECDELRPAPKIFKEDCEIRFAEMTAEQVKNFVRGLSPYPAAWANLTINGKQFDGVKIYAVEVTGYGLQVTGYGLRVTGYGLRVTGKGLRVTGKGDIIIPCREGAVRILELQAPGKKRMDAKSFLNGLH